MLRCSWFASGCCATEAACIERQSLWLQNSWPSTNVAVASFFEDIHTEHYINQLMITEDYSENIDLPATSLLNGDIILLGCTLDESDARICFINGKGFHKGG